MKVVILCGGLGTRIKEESEYRPKPMIKIGPRPILWHIMNRYSHYGFKKFVLCLGYKGEMIKEYFYNYEIMNNDITVKLGQRDNVKIYNSCKENDWEITLVNTGEQSLKGARLKKIEQHIDSDIFMVTYGDGVADIDINNLIKFHKTHGKIATITGVLPFSRFGTLMTNENKVTEFREKPENTEGLINGGFFVFNRKIFDYLTTDEDCNLETGVLDKLAFEEELMVFRHPGSWMCMDTMRDMEHLNELWTSGNAFWKV